MNDHHAITYTGVSIADTALPDEYRHVGPDVTHIETVRLSIGDVRALIMAAQQRPVSAPHRVFVVVAQALPVEAQNALLKLFEEPPTHARFYLVVPQVGMLLPTLRSRVFIADDAELAVKGIAPAFRDFMAMSYGDRMTHITALAKAKDVDTMYAIADGAEQYAMNTKTPAATLLRTVETVSRYIRTQGASKKMLLEHLALSLPVEKL